MVRSTYLAQGHRDNRHQRRMTLMGPNRLIPLVEGLSDYPLHTHLPEIPSTKTQGLMSSSGDRRLETRK
jgi:hypothetical protein